MLKVRFSTRINYLAGLNSPPILNFTNERYIKYYLAIHGDAKGAQRLKEEIKRYASGDAKKNFDGLVKSVIEYKIQYWHFDFTDKEERVVSNLARKLHMAIGAKSSNVITIGDITAGISDTESVSMEDVATIFDSEPVDITFINDEYKKLLYGVYYISKRLQKDKTKEGIGIKTLYTKWLHMTNKNQNFLRPSMLKGTYRNNKEPNHIINMYSSTGGITADFKLDGYAQEYIDTFIGKNISVNDYFIMVYQLFRQILGYDILNENRDYYDKDIDKEIEKLIKEIPNEKFNISFLEKTIDPLNWKELNLDEVRNEYNIEAFSDPTMLKDEIPRLEPVTTAPSRSLKKDLDYMQIINLKSNIENGVTGTLYKQIYTNRMVSLRSNVETHPTYREIERAVEANNSSIGLQDSRLRINISAILPRIKEFKIRHPEVNERDEASELVERKVNERIEQLSQSIFRRYSNTEWNLPEMDNLFASTVIENQLIGSKTVRDGIVYAMGKPVVINNIDILLPEKEEIEEKHIIKGGFYVTEDGLLINNDFIIKPRKIQQSIPGLGDEIYKPLYYEFI